ncbi:hypothetical protein FA95DRAFT_1488915 [Auriscalpium vulgare]|uniref:Uncharacterized protein n=1 Tax=Auriscalpium vulgare TaxID=40419 RepID=A0ACB8RZE5_9AGAM|nr:hypothetical protein FA95DRAFT_1488915 [Auriscalpium vulgare]
MSLPRYPVDVDGLMSAGAEGIAAIRAGLEAKKQQSRAAKHRCDYCGKEDDDKKPLQACTGCRTVRYCNKTCQTAHYRVAHKRDCSSFSETPLCRPFNPKLILAGCSYPEVPIFAKAHVDGMGCWVSPSGSIDCSLAALPGSRIPSRNRDNMSMEQLLAALPGAPGRFLDIRVMVQNRVRRKGAPPMVVVGKCIIAISSARGTPQIIEGNLPGEVNVKLQDWNGSVTPLFLKLTHYNGKEVKSGERLAALKDDKTTSVVLHQGDFVIFELQYRCGGPNISRDFEAWELLDHIFVPSVPYDPAFSGPWSELLPRAVEKDDSVCEVRAKVSQELVDRWFADYKQKGQDAYIRSHYGEARAQMIAAGNNALGQHMAMMMDMAMGGGLGR